MKCCTFVSLMDNHSYIEYDIDSNIELDNAYGAWSIGDIIYYIVGHSTSVM